MFVMDKKYDIILNVTTSCNYNCSYCNVVKDWKSIDKRVLEDVIHFIKENEKFINYFKFFGWEPLISFDKIKYLIDNTWDILKWRFEIVTNTFFLNDDIGKYFKDYFWNIFFSIDTENNFDFEKILTFIDEFSLKEKVIFNIIFNPWEEGDSYRLFQILYKNWFKNFNLLPVYFTKFWNKENLENLSKVLKKIIDLSVEDKEIFLYGFQKNNGYNYSLTYNSIFCNYDWCAYFSDFVSTTLGYTSKKELFLWYIKNMDLKKLFWIQNKKNILKNFELKIIDKIKWQKELHKIMDYFSKYLNEKWIIKD
jgi:sulfatase maturation enzyme AslB (radical SAM superfamily)